MVKGLAKQAMTTKGQKACYVIDHLVKALGNNPSSPLRRAMILNDIAQYPNTTQVAIMERLSMMKSVVSREVDWLYDMGCIRVHINPEDARSKTIEIYGYTKTHFTDALEYFDGDYGRMGSFLKGLHKFLRVDKPTLRDAKIVSSLYEMKQAPKAAVIHQLYGGSASTDHRAYNKLKDVGVIDGV